MTKLHCIIYKANFQKLLHCKIDYRIIFIRLKSYNMIDNTSVNKFYLLKNKSHNMITQVSELYVTYSLSQIRYYANDKVTLYNL